MEKKKKKKENKKKRKKRETQLYISVDPLGKAMGKKLTTFEGTPVRPMFQSARCHHHRTTAT
jgi:hypothetical protein